MKNVVLGVVGGFLILYTALLSLLIYGGGTRRNELENALGQVVKQTLEEYYVPPFLRDGTENYPTKDEIVGKLGEKMQTRVTSESDIAVTVTACDLEKGILSVRVEEAYRRPGGSVGHIRHEKTAIIDREAEEDRLCRIEFWVRGVLYKSYTKTVGEDYPVPKEPEGNFRGWKSAAGGGQGDFSAGQKVTKTEKWIADMGN